MILSLDAESVFQSGPLTVNSIGNPRFAEKPCCDRSWNATRPSPGALRIPRISAMNCCSESARSLRGTRVMNRMPVFTCPPPKPPIAQNRFFTSGRARRAVSHRRITASVASIDEPTGVVTRPSVTPMSSGGVSSLLIPPIRESDAANIPPPARTTSQRHLKAPPRERRYAAASPSNARSTPRPNQERFPPTARNCAQRDGVSVRASISERNTATEMVTPNWKKNLPTMPRMNATGRKIAMIAAVAASAAKAISRAPVTAAWTRPSPCSALR